MSEQLLNDPQVGATLEEMRRERVAEGVRTDPPAESRGPRRRRGRSRTPAAGQAGRRDRRGRAARRARPTHGASASSSGRPSSSQRPSQSSAMSPTGTSRSRSPFPITRTKPPSSERSSTIESRRLADPEARGVEQLEQRPCPQVRRGLEEGLDLLDRQRLGEQARLARQVDVGGDVDARSGRRRRRTGRSPRMLAARRRSEVGARPGSCGRPRRVRDGEVADGRILRPIPARRRAARRREVLEVGAVGADRRRREAALHAEVGEEVVDRPVEVGRGRHVSPDAARAVCHASARSSSSRAERPRRLRAAAEHRRQLLDRAPSRRAGWTSVTVRPSRSRFAIRKWASAWAAICGRWVTHRTWWRRASAQRLRPIGSALRPPIPVSISSKTSVGVSSTSARTCLIARATRLISPPEAILASGRAGSPEFGASRNTTWSTPLASNASASPSSSTAGSSSSAGSPAEGDLEHAVREAERHEHRPDRRRRAPVPPPPGRPTGAAAATATSLQESRVLGLAGVALVVEPAQPVRLGERPARRGRSPPPRRRRSVARGRRSRRAAPRGERAPLGRARRTRPARGPSRPTSSALRLEAGDPLGERLEPPVEPGEAARLVGRDRDGVAGAPLVGRERLVRASRCRGRSPRRAASRRAGPGSRRPRPGAAAPPRSRSPRARRSRAGGPARAGRARAPRAPPGSPASGRPPRSSSPAAARGRRTRRAGRAASARRGVAAGRAGRGSRRGRRRRRRGASRSPARRRGGPSTGRTRPPRATRSAAPGGGRRAR